MPGQAYYLIVDDQGGLADESLHSGAVGWEPVGSGVWGKNFSRFRLHWPGPWSYPSTMFSMAPIY